MTNPDNNASQPFEDAAAKQTFVEKAFEELEGLNCFLMQTTPPGIIAMAQSGMNAIDTLVDRTPEDKEALKAFLILLASVEQFDALYMFDDTRRFKDRYNQKLSDMVVDFIEGNETPDQIQAGLALNIGKYETLAKNMKDPAYRSELLKETTQEDIAKQAQLAITGLDSISNDQYSTAPKLIDRLKALLRECTEAARAPLDLSNAPKLGSPE